MKYSPILILCLFFGCTSELPQAIQTAEKPILFPDYADVTIPPNVAPLNFKLQTPSKGIALLSHQQQTVRVDAANGKFAIPQTEWHQLVQNSVNDTIRVTIYAQTDGKWLQYEPFNLYVAPDSMDNHLVYRLVVPGYHMWNEMGIYQRCLENFDEEMLINNKFTDNNCVNCHSFCNQDPQRMLFHQRTNYAGTYMIVNGNIEKLDTKTDATISALVYPSWHPSGRYVAFSTNDTKQDFHLLDTNRIEVFDNASDVVVYDVKKHCIYTSDKISSADNFETFPTFSPDGRTLYFCSAPAAKMPDSFRQVKYNLLAIDFEPDNHSFGQKIDTLYNARLKGRSVKFPRVSPNGQQLLYTVSDYGNFSIWHKDADLQMLNLDTRTVDSLPSVNSYDTESYHSWSSNSRWFVFSSRRINGLYTCPYICYIDAQGHTGKPFLLPQEDADYYDQTLFSFNIPEFVREKVELNRYELVDISKNTTGKKISFVK